MYAIKKGRLYVRDSRYIGSVGKVSAYTTDVNRAAIYTTREEAQKNACGNETVVKLTITTTYR